MYEGGTMGDDITDYCSYYSIKDDKWIEAPSLNKERVRNSTCTLGNFVYTYGGEYSEPDEDGNRDIL